MARATLSLLAEAVILGPDSRLPRFSEVGGKCRYRWAGVRGLPVLVCCPGCGLVLDLAGGASAVLKVRAGLQWSV